MRYRIVKNDIAPRLGVKELAIYNKCYLGVSINNPFFRDQYLGLLMKWMANHFDKSLIIIGDYLNRINEMIIHGKSETDAIEDSIRKGDDIEDKIKIAISLLPQDKFTVYRWIDLIRKYPDANDEKMKLISMAKKNPEFAEQIQISASDFIDRLLNRGQRLSFSKTEAIEKSKMYLFEEMALFSILIQKGYKVQIYPGTQLRVLKLLANGAFPSLGSPLKNGIYVDLKIKKSK
jgi:tRNA-dependent cyclodipeptide synthase